MKLHRFFEKAEGSDPDEWPLPTELVFTWLAFGVPALLGIGLVMALYFGARQSPVQMEKQILAGGTEESALYALRLYYTTESGRFEVHPLATIFYSDLEQSGPFTALYWRFFPKFALLKGIRGFWMPLLAIVVFFTLICGGFLWLGREIARMNMN
ncbi:MAG: hypothetical protein N2050_00480 [Flavobacteriales bacterium]|nr:hypothetical protein [Flavobacteriales bacterium]